MRITDALKPVTDALATAGMSLESATYKDGKIHATLNTGTPKAAGEPGSGPEYPPEGYRILSQGERSPLTTSAATWVGKGWQVDHWSDPSYVVAFPQMIVAVPIAPKPEPVKLTDQEKIVGWRGPNGFRLQTFQNRDVQCAVCKKTIKAGERLARWRHKFPEAFDQDITCGKPGNEENHSHAHVDCLYKVTRGIVGSVPLLGLIFQSVDVPKWLQEKRQKFDGRQSTP